MLPKNSGSLTLPTLPDKTPRLDGTRFRVQGYAEGIEAVRQAVELILQTERYEYLIFSYNYGVELGDLFGKDADYCIPEIERRVCEALSTDDRVLSVDNFVHNVEKGKICSQFNVKTRYGDFQTGREVEI